MYRIRKISNCCQPKIFNFLMLGLQHMLRMKLVCLLELSHKLWRSCSLTYGYTYLQLSFVQFICLLLQKTLTEHLIEHSLCCTEIKNNDSVCLPSLLKLGYFTIRAAQLKIVSTRTFTRLLSKYQIGSFIHYFTERLKI